MEKVSTKEFFMVMWRGVYQTLGWFFGLFGYKKDGKFAKCVWGLFATSAAILTNLCTIAATLKPSDMTCISAPRPTPTK